MRPGEASLAAPWRPLPRRDVTFPGGCAGRLRGSTIGHRPRRSEWTDVLAPSSCCWRPSIRARVASFGVDGRECRCEDGARRRYQARLSGPMRDRLDLVVPLEPVVSALGPVKRPRASIVGKRCDRGGSAGRATAVPNAELPLRRLDAPHGFARRCSTCSSSRPPDRPLLRLPPPRGPRPDDRGPRGQRPRRGTTSTRRSSTGRGARGMIGVGVSPSPGRTRGARASASAGSRFPRVPGIGPAGFAQLVRRHGSAACGSDGLRAARASSVGLDSPRSRCDCSSGPRRPAAGS